MFTTRIVWKNEIGALTAMTNAGKTFGEIALKYNVSKQRIKQVFVKHRIEHVGLKKLKLERQIAWCNKWGAKVDTDLYDAQRTKYRGKKANALRAGTEFTIAFGEIDWRTHCPYLGIELDFFAEGRQENSCSFDRIDINKGYVKGNVLICSWRANRIKNDGTAEEHRKIAEFMSVLQNT